MKIRKLIFSAKLEQIERAEYNSTENQNSPGPHNQNRRSLPFGEPRNFVAPSDETPPIFIFHCNANAAQWRFLKNFLWDPSGAASSPGPQSSALRSSTKRTEGTGGVDRVETFGGPHSSRSPHFFPDGGALYLPLRKLESYKESGGARGLTPLAQKRGGGGAAGPGGRLPIPKEQRQHCRGATKSNQTALSDKHGGDLLSWWVGGSTNWLRGYTFFQSGAPTVGLGNGAPTLLARSPNSEAGPPSPEGAYKGKGASSRPPSAHLIPTKAAALSGAPRAPLGPNFVFRPPCRPPRSLFYCCGEQRPKGCLFYFDTRSHTIFESHQKNSLCLELVNKIESIENGGPAHNNLILLYGQMKSTVVNHVDIKEALILDARTTYQQLFISMHSLSIALKNCLHGAQLSWGTLNQEKSPPPCS